MALYRRDPLVIPVVGQCISLCNEAASLIEEQKNYQKAISQFLRALHIISQTHGSLQTDRGHSKRCSYIGGSHERSNSAFFDIDAFVPPRAAPSLKQNDSAGYNDRNFMCRGPIRIPAPLAEAGIQEELVSILHIVLTFNLALAYHLLASTATADQESIHMNRTRYEELDSMKQMAMEMYQHSLHLLQESNGAVTSTTSMFRLVTLNNLAHICLLLGDDGRRRTYLQELLTETTVTTTSKLKKVDPVNYESFVEMSMVGLRLCRVHGAEAA